MEHITSISFPGLGIDSFNVKNTAFSIFDHSVMWYGIIITAGMIIAYLYASFRARKNEGISSYDMLDYTIYAVVFGIIGARLYYVITKFQEFKGDTFGETFVNIVSIWNGGLAVYGGIIAGIAAIYVTSRIKKQPVSRVLDAVAPGVMLAQAIGRWGNFFNGEAFGSATALPWRMCGKSFASYLLANNNISSDTYYDMLSGTVGVHPTFLYESLWNIIGFIILNLLYRKKKFNGQIILTYISWYGLGRFFIEGLRTDSLYFLESVLGKEIRISQALAALCFICGSAALIVLTLKNKNKKITAQPGNVISADITETYAAAENTDTMNADIAAENDQTTEENYNETD